jgi:ubiquinone/menaquinone biosynthesis C-methylase UbiE
VPAERLPFADDSFDDALAVLTLLHWTDVDAGLAEMTRVARRRIVIVTFDPDTWETSGSSGITSRRSW